MTVWERIEENRRRLDVTSADQVELRLLRRYALRAEVLMRSAAFGLERGVLNPELAADLLAFLDGGGADA